MKSKIPISNQRGFTLIEVVIVSGIIGLMSLFIMQMTKTMNDNMNRMDTRMAEQNLLYLTRLALTDKFACSRTLGGYCESTLTPGTPHLDSSSNPIAQEGDCTSPGTEATNDIEINEWTSGEFKDRKFTSATAISLASVQGGIIYTRGFDEVLKSCTGSSCSSDEYKFDNILLMKKYIYLKLSSHRRRGSPRWRNGKDACGV